MKAKVLALSNPETQTGNINFAYCVAPEGMAVASLVNKASLKDFGIDKEKNPRVMRVCITGHDAPAVGKDLDGINVNTTLRGTTIELPGASFALNKSRTVSRLVHNIGVNQEVAKLTGLTLSGVDLLTAAHNNVNANRANRRASAQPTRSVAFNASQGITDL